MRNLEFITTGDWNLQGSNKKELYISLTAKIDGWKKNIIFYKSKEKEAFIFLLQFILESKNFIDWKFSISSQGGYMNSIYASQVFWIKDESGNIIFTEIEKGENYY
jgi:hypothetical protein